MCVCVRAAVVPLLPGRAADTYLPGPGAGSPGLQDASEAADGGVECPEGAEAATGGTTSQGRPRAPPLGPEGRALPLPAQRGPETGETRSAACVVQAVREQGPHPGVFVTPQASQSKQEQRQEEAAERRLRKASKEVLQMRGQSQKEPLPVQTFRLGLCRLELCFHCVIDDCEGTVMESLPVMEFCSFKNTFLNCNFQEQMSYMAQHDEQEM